MDGQTFDRIVASIYQSASGSAPWETALEQVREAFAARMVFLHTADTRDGQIISIRYGGAPSHNSVLEYIRAYHHHDPRRAKILGALPSLTEHGWHCHEHLSEDFIAKDRFFQEFLTAYDARYTSVIPLAPSGPGDSAMTAFAVELPRARGPLNADERALLRRLGLHMLEALRIHQRIRALMAQALAGHRLLQNFAYPMWLLDHERGISFQNAAAASIVATANRIAQVQDRLVLCRQRAHRELTRTVHALMQKPHGSMAVIDLRSSASDPPMWLHLSLLSPGAALGAFGAEPRVLATLFDPSHVSILDPFALSSMFNLTPAEARVAAGLGSGFTAAQIGEQLGTSENTIRTHTRKVLVKLAVPRTVDVVRMLRQGEALWAGAGSSLL